jgi:SRSO17 transposase
LLRRDGKYRPISVKKLAIGLPMDAWRKITWREGTAERLSSRFACVRIRPAHRDYWLAESRPEEWLLIEWPEGAEAPTKYWFSTLPESIGFRQLVDTAKLRWRIERDYHELKQEIGLGHFEGRGWRGFHHHATLCIAAYGFLVSERETIPPQQQVPPGFSKRLRFPKLIARGVPPLRPERHVPNSISTVRRKLSAALASTLSRCPCCIRAISRQSSRRNL